MGKFSGKNIYITGGSSGIGLELSKRFAEKGANILLIARNREKLENAVKEIKKLGDKTQKFLILSLDVSDFTSVNEKIPKIIKEFGEPDILVNNAGIGTGSSPFEDMSYEVFDKIIKVNLYGVWNVTKILFPFLKKNKGQIVIVSSAAGLFGMHDYTAYGTSKGALNIFAESLRYEAKPYGISVTLVCPPEVETPFIEEEASTLSPIARKVKNMVGLLSTEFVAKEIIKGVEKKKFCLIPGVRTGLFYLFHRLTNGWSSRFFVDIIIGREKK